MSAEGHNLDVRAEREPEVTILYLCGEVDLRTAPQLRGTFLDLVDEKPARIILDLSGVSYVDSSGVGTIVELKRRAMRHKSKVVLVGLQERVRSVFEITRLNKFFDITHSIDEAREV
ncbi:MAG: STAS domain-containing protein [Planctomycetes bacterium]|nr:STAS domain-containing protein [Planctomycetota bacterium]